MVNSCLAHCLGNKGPHLIVVPSSIFDNWRKELELWCPALKVSRFGQTGSNHVKHSIKTTLIVSSKNEYQVLPYTGNQDERAQIRDEIMDENALENYNILISTYSQVRILLKIILACGINRFKLKILKKDYFFTLYIIQMTSTTEDRILFKNQPFNYVIYDEAHQLKNMDTQKYQHLMRVSSMNVLPCKSVKSERLTD